MEFSREKQTYNIDTHFYFPKKTKKKENTTSNFTQFCVKLKYVLQNKLKHVTFIVTILKKLKSLG